MNSKSKSVYWTTTSRHDEAGVVVFGPVAVPVSVLLVFFVLSQIGYMLINWPGDVLWGWNGVGWAIFGVFWFIVFSVGSLWALAEGARWMYYTLKDANDWKAGQR